MRYHYLNFIDEDDEEDEEVILKINKRLIPRDYTFYKIYKNGCENYVGSTVDLYMRKARHKSSCNNEKSSEYNKPLYQYIRANGGYDTFDYEILDTRFCCQKDAEIHEGELMRIHKSTLNVFRNYTKEDKRQYQKEYQKSDKFKEYRKSDKCKECQKKSQKKFREKRKQIHLTINLNINLPQD